MVPRGGFEPPALGLEVLCSIQLSYRGVAFILTDVAWYGYKNEAKAPRFKYIWCGWGESNPRPKFGKLVY